MQESIIEFFNGGQMDVVQHGQGRRKQAEGTAQDWVRRSLHVEAY